MTLPLTKLGKDVFAGRDAAGNPRQVDNGEAVVWSTEMERALDGAVVGRIDQVTWSGLSAITGAHTGQPAQVYGPDAGTHTDPVVGGTVANTGTFIWSASPAGWRRVGGLPAAIIHALNTGTGTANAVQATVDATFATEPYRALVSVNFTATNSGAMTLAINGETPRAIVTNIGDPIPADYVIAGMAALVQIDEDGAYRFFTYGDAAAVQAAAEAALAAIRDLYLGAFANDAAATAAAGGSPVTGQLYTNTTSDLMRRWNGTGWVDATQVAGTINSGSAVSDGVETDFTLPDEAEAANTHIYIDGRRITSGYTLSAGALSFSEAVGDGVPIDWDVFEIVPLGVTTTSMVVDGEGNTLADVLADLETAVSRGGLVVPSDYGAVGDGTTDDTDALQAMFDDIAAGVVIYLEAKTYKYTTLTIDTGCTVWSGHLSSDKDDDGAQITVGKSARVTWVAVELSGGGGKGTAVNAHDIVRQQGTSRTDRAVGMGFYRCKIHGAGLQGVWTRWADDVVFEDCHLWDIAYAGLMMESPQRFRMRGGSIVMLDAVGISSNAYGCALTHDTVGYSSDPNAGTPRANNHFPIDCNVDGTTFIGPQIWEALDFHGGYQMTFVNCKIYACKYGIMAGNSSGSAASYAGYQNIIAKNIIDTRLPDGTSAGVTPALGITVQGGASGTLGTSWQLVVTGNVIRGYGNATPSTASVPIHVNVYADQTIVANNIITNWVGYGIVVGLGSGTLALNGNIFSRMSAAGGAGTACIYMTSDYGGRAVVVGNVLDPGTYAPAYGLRVAGSASVSYASDFRGAGTEYSDASGNGRDAWA
ncbi:MAG: right-handed parallel beta-helix repeat-containing protein [Rhizobiales bacterium]|nr:right-handed parallel beta-helix repeat-containing protein [Hyphomicrobiales bacterium]